jgi:hypothetical protein
VILSLITTLPRAKLIDMDGNIGLTRLRAPGRGFREFGWLLNSIAAANEIRFFDRKRLSY